jgi:crotonobetaine/carnitine-CoA ligase
MNRLDLSRTEDRTFPKILRRQAQENGATEFLLNDDIRMSFAQADEVTDRLARGLQDLGVQRGDRVGLFMGNRPEFVLLTLAINKLAAIWVPINTDYKGEWLLDSVRRSRCQVFVTDSEYQQRLLALRSQLDIPHWVLLADVDGGVPADMHDYAELARSERLVSDYSDQDYGDTCAILWTSGTTGKSKGVMQNYNGWIRGIYKGASPLFDSHPGDVIYCALPLFNTGAWITAVYRALLEGLPCVIEPRFSVTTFWERIAKFKATQTFLIGAMGVFLWNQPESEDDAKTPLRRAMIVPFPPDLWQPFEQRFGMEIITTGLGMSECQLIANQLEAPPGLPPYALGYPPDDIELQLCDDEGKQVEPGEAGEMCVKPLQPHVLFNGYFDNEEAVAAAYRGEWFLTGDMARQDPASGALFFVDRKKDVVRFAGRNISTLEVESVFRRHPAIADVAAFGIPSAEIDSEHELKVDIVLREGQAVSPEALCEFVNEAAPHYFVPRYIEFVTTLPYTPTNKVQKYMLREKGVTDSCWDLKKSGFEVQR